VDIDKGRAISPAGYIEDYFAAEALHQSITATPALLIHREVFREIGLFDVNLLRAQDKDMWWRIAHRYPRMGYVAEPLVVVHLDLDVPVLTNRRMEAKRGVIVRTLVERHLKEAAKHGNSQSFRRMAAKALQDSVLMAIYNGYFEDAKDTMERVGMLLNPTMRFVVTSLLKFPHLSKRAMRAAAYAMHVTKLEKNVGRRWQ
jgi:hypothetical protein